MFGTACRRSVSKSLFHMDTTFFQTQVKRTDNRTYSKKTSQTQFFFFLSISFVLNLQTSEHLNVGVISGIALGSHVLGLILLPNFAPAYFTHIWDHILTHRALLLGYGVTSLTIVCLVPILMKMSAVITIDYTISMYFFNHS